MQRKYKKYSVLVFTTAAIVVFGSLLTSSCSKQVVEQPEEKILAKIGDKRTISVNEFIRRAEYVPRPAYCRRNTYLDKKIILNSLIAEKLLAIEAEADNPLDENEQFRDFLLGRKEQAMRQWMHHVEATNNVKLDTTEIKNAYKYAGRQVEISHVLLSDSTLIAEALQNYTQNSIFETLAQRAAGGPAPQRTIKYTDPELTAVHQALFSHDLEIGQVIPPIRIDNGKYLLIKVNGWSDDMAITEEQQQQRLEKVTEKLTTQHATSIWNARVADIMRDKRMDFNPDTFDKLSRLFFNIYFHDDEEQQNRFIEKIWGVERDETRKSFYLGEDENFLSQSFFTVDGRVWTVDDFRRELVRHPLVFRDRKMPSADFPEQFRLAVADLIRDHFVTKEAYRKGYDKVNVVQRNVDMWRDRFLAMYQTQKYFASVGENRNFANHQMAVIEETLNPYIDELQKKYYKQIELDFDTFEDIQLTTIDLFVKQPEMPYKYVVPMFPVLTNDHLLEYVKKAEN